MTTKTTEQEMSEQMMDAMYDAEMCDTESFVEAGVMTNDTGFVVKMADGTEFQVTVVQSR